MDYTNEEFDFENRIMTTSYIGGDDSDSDTSLRPKTLDDYIGQEKAKENLKIYMEAAKMRGESLDHVLLYGPPGLGKTTLSNIIANEMGVNIRVTSGPAIEKQGDLAALLTNLNEGDVLFIDEIHRLSRSIEEILYPAMEDNAIDIIIGKGPAARSIRIDLPHFTLIGATTRAGQLTTPLRDRFGVLLKLELYTPSELATIVKRSANILGLDITDPGAYEIASRSRGTPRIANRLLKRIRDFAQVGGNAEIDDKIADYALSRLEIDELGLDNTDRKMLETIIKFYDGDPVGLETLSATVGESPIHTLYVKTNLETVFKGTCLGANGAGILASNLRFNRIVPMHIFNNGSSTDTPLIRPNTVGSILQNTQNIAVKQGCFRRSIAPHIFPFK